MRTREFETLRSQRFAVRVWRALVAATESQRRINASRRDADRLYARRVRARAWRLWLRFKALARDKRRKLEQASEHHRTRTLRRVLLALASHQSSAVSEQVADAHFLRRAVREWRAQSACSQCARAARIQRFFSVWQRVVLRAHLQRLALFVRRRQRERCASVLRVWKQLPRSRLAQSLLACCGRKVRLASVWRRWRAAVRQATALRARAAAVRARRDHILRRTFFLERWRLRVIRYRQARVTLEGVLRDAVLRISLEAWRQLKRDGDRKRCAAATHARAAKRAAFRALAQAAALARARTQSWKLRSLAARWENWRRFVERRLLLHTAANHWARLRRLRAVSKLLGHAHTVAVQRHQRAVADAWGAAVLLQRVFSAWAVVAARRMLSRQSAWALTWRVVGRRAWLEWRRALVQEQYVRLARGRASRRLLQQTWNALVQVTKRREVAKSMWRYTLARVRLGRCVQRWQLYVAVAARQRFRARELLDRRRSRSLARVFGAWSQFSVVGAFVALRKQRESLWRVRASWRAWVVHCRARCLRREATRRLLHRVLVAGLQRNVVRRQAARVVERCHAEQVRRQVLKRWRVELWLRAAQRAVEFRRKESALQQWLRFAARRQEKRASVVAAQLQQRHSDAHWRCNKQRRESQQTAVSCQRRLARGVLQAWHLAAKCQKRSRSREETWRQRGGFVVASQENRALVSNSEAGGGNQRRQAHRALARPRPRKDSSSRLATGNVPTAKKADDLDLLGLEFWATRLVATCFYTWKRAARVHHSAAMRRVTRPQRQRH
ncbi:hypothetical protein PybrP1_002580 [[Pythium] brassicae (nom. inval.)]|nr:hypothetical protein PybrP1_002580 [[Pythium] brassicae (nom. inval.)]